MVGKSLFVDNMLISVFFGFLIQYGSSLPHGHNDDESWSYNDVGTRNWPGECKDGRNQSPIDIARRKTIEDFGGKMIYSDLLLVAYHNVSFHVTNKGVTVSFDVTNSTAILRGGPLKREYVLHSFHYHTPSEHTLDYIKYPLEIHFVHRRRDLTIEEALREDDGVAVIAKFVMVTSRQSDGESMSQLLPYLDQVATIGDEIITGRIDVRNLIGDYEYFYTYQGSLTTPNCEEVVTWIILEEPLTINDAQFTVFRKLIISTPSNYRSVQPTNNRKIYRSIGTSSGQSLRPPSLFKIILGVVFDVATLLTNFYAMVGTLASDFIDQTQRNDKVFRTVNLVN